MGGLGRLVSGQPLIDVLSLTSSLFNTLLLVWLSGRCLFADGFQVATDRDGLGDAGPVVELEHGEPLVAEQPGGGGQPGE